MLYHIDMYRLKNSGEMEELGLSEIFASTQAYVVIEWAEKLGELIPPERLDIHFTVLTDGSHEITVKDVTT